MAKYVAGGERWRRRVKYSLGRSGGSRRVYKGAVWCRRVHEGAGVHRLVQVGARGRRRVQEGTEECRRVHQGEGGFGRVKPIIAVLTAVDVFRMKVK